jgi:hypothetical protein
MSDNLPLTPSLALAELEASLKHNGVLDQTLDALAHHRQEIDSYNQTIANMRDLMTPHQEAINQFLIFLGEHEHVSEERIEELRRLAYPQSNEDAAN